MNSGSGNDRDEWLMAEVTEGRAESLEVLVRWYGTMLLSFIFRMVHDHQRSEDLFQDVFLLVWRKREKYRFPNPFKPWLYRIAVNRVRQVLRRRGERRIRLIEDSEPIEPPDVQSSPDESAIAVESSTLVQQAVALLPDKQRMVVTLRIWNGMSYGQIAQAMDVREATVRSNMHDALITIRRFLEPRM